MSVCDVLVSNVLGAHEYTLEFRTHYKTNRSIASFLCRTRGAREHMGCDTNNSLGRPHVRSSVLTTQNPLTAQTELIHNTPKPKAVFGGGSFFLFPFFFFFLKKEKRKAYSLFNLCNNMRACCLVEDKKIKTRLRRRPLT